MKNRYIHLSLLFTFLHFSLSSSLYDTSSLSPYFLEPIENKTAILGRSVTFQCAVANLNDKQVAWIRKDQHIILSLQDVLITQNKRLRVSNHDGKTFCLHIDNVDPSDEGEYMCQINSKPKSLTQSAFLQVHVPPSFDTSLTNDDTEVKDGDDVSLRCVAKGVPEPKIEWRREDREPISPNSHLYSHKVDTIHGEWLNITSVSRIHMGYYLCIASNGLTTSVSKRIYLGVQFSPLLWTPLQQVGAIVSTEATLTCIIESHPPAEVYWTKSGTILPSNTKYITRLIKSPKSDYKYEMSLTISSVAPSDFTLYTCVAPNALGEVSGEIRLYEKKVTRFTHNREKLNNFIDISKKQQKETLTSKSTTNTMLTNSYKTGGVVSEQITFTANTEENNASIKCSLSSLLLMFVIIVTVSLYF